MFVIVSGGWFSNSMDGEESNILDVDIEFHFRLCRKFYRYSFHPPLQEC